MTKSEAWNNIKRGICIPYKHETLAKIKEVLEQEPRWIPIKTRPMTEEETEHYFEYMKYQRIDDVYTILDCPLPDDGQEVLVTTRYDEVKTDTFYRDDGCYFETYCDEDDVKAWMPLPEHYKEGESK